MAADDVVEIVLVGNPVMHHLLLGIDPVELGGAPFALAVDTSVEMRAAELGLRSMKARASMFFPASPAMSAPMPPAWCWPRRRRRM